MGKQQKEWARRKRVELIFELGGQCKYCGTCEDLTFDCIIPQGDKHHRMDTSARMSFYRFQHYELKNIQLLCDRCNSRKKANEDFDEDSLWDIAVSYAQLFPV